MNLKSISDYLTTALTNTNQFYVTDGVQKYDKDFELTEGEYIPATLTLISTFPEENGFRSTFGFNLHFKFERSKIDTFYADIDTFIANEVTVTEGSFQVVKTYQSVRYTNESIVDGVDYYEFDLAFNWVYNLSVVGKNSIIKIDAVEIPFTSCNVTHDVSYISNESSGNNYRMTNDIITLEIPLILTNTTVSSLYADINSNDYNKTYTLEINGISKSVALKQGIYLLTNTSQIVGMTLTLETAYPRVTLTLDGEVIPNSAYHFNGKKLNVTASKTDAKTLAYPTEKVKSWSITLVKDSSTVYDKVITDGYGSDITTTYTLVRDGVSYTVFLADFVERYTETGDMAVECQFLEYGG